jgi:beta-glucosidase
VRPVRELKAFKRIRLEPGDTKTVHFRISAKHLAFYDNEEQHVVEEGKFDVFIGGSSLGAQSSRFELIP